MAKLRIELDTEGMRELLESAAIESELVERMGAVQDQLPDSYMEVVKAGRRVQVRVFRGSDYEEANTGELSAALDAAGGQRGNLWSSAARKTHG